MVNTYTISELIYQPCSREQEENTYKNYRPGQNDGPTNERLAVKTKKTYKKVANRIKPVATTLPKEFRIERRIPSDPLATIPMLPIHPPEFEPGRRYTLERKEAMPVNKDGFLWPEEEQLAHHL